MPQLRMERVRIMNTYNDVDTIGRYGYISAVDPKTHRARVSFPELGIISGWLPVGVANTFRNQDEILPDVGEHVYCIMHDNTGIILCSIYDDKNRPGTGNADRRTVTFQDGTQIYYDRKSNVLNVKDKHGNTIILDKDGVTVKSTHNMTIESSGSMTISSGGGMDISAGGTMNLNAPTINLN